MNLEWDENKNRSVRITPSFESLPCRTWFSCDEIVEITLDFKRHVAFSCVLKFRANERRRNEAISTE